MQLQEILAAKGSTVYTIRAQATLDQVVDSLVRHNCGSLVVCEADDSAGRRLLGIITERDILKAAAHNRQGFGQMSVAEVMTRDVLTGTPSDTVEETMGLMTQHRVRHLPILQDDRLVGIISIGDVVKSQYDHLTLENHFLKSYISG